MTTVELVIEADSDEPTCATVMVDATVTGVRYRFVVDTGAGRTTLVADELTRALPPSGYQTSAGLFGTAIDARVTVPDFRLGELPARNVEVRVECAQDECSTKILSIRWRERRMRRRKRQRYLGSTLAWVIRRTAAKLSGSPESVAPSATSVLRR